MEIIDIEAPERGCGTRQQGGFYMVGEIPTETTTFFPRSLRCECGIQFIRPSRGAQHFYPGQVWKCLSGDEAQNPYIHFPEDKKCWALTIDVSSYPTPAHYIEEGLRMGISRRLNNGLPKGFKIGEDYAFIIHSKAMEMGGGKVEPGFIMCFKPTAVQYVVSGKESLTYLQSLADKGITLVNVPNSRPPKNA